MQSRIGLLILRHGCFTPEENMSNINTEKVAIVKMNSSLPSVCACLFFFSPTDLFISTRLEICSVLLWASSGHVGGQ